MTRILTIPEVDGSPVVPGAFLVLRCADGHYKAVGPERPSSGPHRAELPCIAKLWKARPGVYAVSCETDMMAKLDPTNKGKTFAQLALSADAATWPCKDGVDGSCCISSSLGLEDTRPVARSAELEPI